MKEQRNLSRNGASFTQINKPFPFLSPFAYFPVGHNTNQTAKVSKQADSAGVQTRSVATAAERALRDTGPSSGHGPGNGGSSLGRSGSRTQGWHQTPANRLHRHQRCWLRATNRSIPAQPNLQRDRNLQSPNVIRHFRKWGFDIKYVLCFKSERVKLYGN